MMNRNRDHTARNGPRPGGNRRQFLQSGGGAVAAGGLPLLLGGIASTAPPSANAPPRRKKILLTGCRHDTNIGDQAHAPGMLRLIQTHLPGTAVTLWPVPSAYGPDQPTGHRGRQRQLDAGLGAMLRRSFPDLEILAPAWASAAGDREAVAERDAAFAAADLMISGSGGGIKGVVRDWREETSKPWGGYGVTLSSPRPSYADASFLFCRDTPSVQTLRDAAMPVGHLAFAPDSTFAMDLRDEASATRFLEAHGLVDRRFLCVVPRLRYSPYPQMYGYPPSPAERERMETNDRHRRSDHETLRQLIIAFVRETGWRVLACPEMTYGVDLARQELVDPLPDDVRPQVVWRDSFWLCDEAASVFAKALAMVSLDCHSPILALAAGTPAVHVRLPTDNPFKSQMFADIGLPEWVRQHESTTAEQLVALVMNIVRDHDAATARVQEALSSVRQRQWESMRVVRQTLWPTVQPG